MKQIDLDCPRTLRDEARVAYIEGKPALADVYDALADALDRLDELEGERAALDEREYERGYERGYTEGKEDEREAQRERIQ